MEKLILFDIDGTLTRTQGGYLPFNEAILKTFGIPGDIRTVIPDGNTDPLIVEEIFAGARMNMEITEEQWLRFARELRESYADALRAGATRVTPLPGAAELIRAIAGTKVIGQSIVTGNFEAIAQVKLKAADLHAYFSRGAYGSDSRYRVDLPAIAKGRWEKAADQRVNADQCVIVGDTPKDLKAAQKNGMKCVLVATGRYSLEELEYYKPDGCVPDLSDSERVVKLLLRL